MSRAHAKAKLALLQGDCEDDIGRCLDVHVAHVWKHMVAGADPATKLGLPVLNIPFQASGADDAWSADGEYSNVLVEPIRLSLSPNTNPVSAALQEEAQAIARDEVQASLRVFRVSLEDVQVVKLAQALVDSATHAAHGHDIQGALDIASPNVLDCFAKVCRILIRNVDDRCLWEALQRVLVDRV